jgi:phospholipase C
MRTTSRALLLAACVLAACGKDQPAIQATASTGAANSAGGSLGSSSGSGSGAGSTSGTSTSGGSTEGASSTATGSSGSTASASSAASSTGSGASTGSSGSSASSSSTGSSGSTGAGYIDHLVIIVLENHTFDSMFATFPGAEGRSHFVFDDGGLVIDAQPAPDFPPHDLCHAHSCALEDWDQGAMDGWAHNGDQQSHSNDDLAFKQYDGSSIPGFWGLASNYAVADHFFSSMLGPSFPGHTFLVAGQAGGSLGNPDSNIGIPLPIWGCDDPATSTVSIENETTCQTQNVKPCFSIPSPTDLLEPGTTWGFYGTGVSFAGASFVWSMFDAVDGVRHGSQWSNVVPYSQYEDDIAQGTLPNVTWLVDQDLNSGHPPFSMCASDTWATRYTNDIINSPYWEHAAVIITWDDFGGWYDHVPPPQQYGCDATHPYGLGFRLPAIIVSPWVKHGVFHGVSEQASVVRLVEELFGAQGSVGALHAADARARDDVAGSLLDAFDFNQQPLPKNPVTESCP